MWMKMNEMTVFRVIGDIKKPGFVTSFRKEVIALKREHAIERVYAEMGSRHRVKRFHIDIRSVEEVVPENIEDPLLRKMICGEMKVGGQD